MKRYGLSLAGLALMSMSITVQAMEFSVGGSALIEQLKIEGERFTPVVAEIEFALTDLESGWGAELHLGTGVKEDDAVNVDVEVEHQSSLFLTYSSVFDEKYRVWLGAGYSLIALDIRNQAGFPGSEEFDGASFEIGAQEYWFQGIPNLSLVGTFRHVFEDDNLTVQGLSLGVRYDF